ncbi:hypothetical protein KJ641_00030 [Patescibacteria group bacterium]|nr:hypothetical protein [Patescibacteria group bacterium]MBU1895247.1 hypothetical protein [Patescibacteria group bacterium]
MSFVPQNLTIEEIQKKELEFSSLSLGEKGKEQAWAEMHEYFSQALIADDRKFWYSYFRWYTKLSWQYLMTREHEFITSMAIPRQLPMAIMLDFDVWSELMWYFTFKFPEEKELVIFYAQIKKNLFESQQVLGEEKGVSVMLRDIIKEIIVIDRQGNDSLQVAEMQAKLGRLFFPSDKEEIKMIFSENHDEMVGRFYDLIHFFMGVESDGIGYVVKIFENPEKAEFLEKFASGEIELATPVESIPTPISISKSVPKEKPIEKPKEKNKPTPAEIKKLVETRFKPNTEGEIENIEGVMAMLDSLAEEYGDERIRELYYFDEDSEKFIWNV